MAKQSGIHQLRGKVGEHSYYRQTGVQSGLVRSINQGMSSRVKTDAAFANTRLNNAEFGQAGRLASVLAQYISPKFRPMVLPFSQSKMAKIILGFIKNDTSSPWGRRNIVQANSSEFQVSALNSVSKNRFDDFGFVLTLNEEVGSLTITSTTETVNKLLAIGANGLFVRFLATATAIGKYSNILSGYAMSFPNANSYQVEVSNPAAGDSELIDYTVPDVPGAPDVAIAATRTGILIVLPYRSINGVDHILQEHCSFKAFTIVDGTVA